MPLDPFDVSRLIKFTLCVHSDIIIGCYAKIKFETEEEMPMANVQEIKKLWKEFKIELKYSVLREIIGQLREEWAYEKC